MHSNQPLLVHSEFKFLIIFVDLCWFIFYETHATGVAFNAVCRQRYLLRIQLCRVNVWAFVVWACRKWARWMDSSSPSFCVCSYKYIYYAELIYSATKVFLLARVLNKNFVLVRRVWCLKICVCNGGLKQIRFVCCIKDEPF